MRPLCNYSLEQGGAGNTQPDSWLWHYPFSPQLIDIEGPARPSTPIQRKVKQRERRVQQRECIFMFYRVGIRGLNIRRGIATARKDNFFIIKSKGELESQLED